jgi:DNA-binding HxlR family transcriptional regulator/catechol 2,3-dioxygenase-like lactoylglutathione lyase family enzyme
VHRIVEDVVGCKWTLHVLAQVRAGVNRPGALVRTAEGLTTKVLNERLSKLVRYGVLEKQAFPEVPPRVEYRLTPFGERLNGVLDAIARMGEETPKATPAISGIAPFFIVRNVPAALAFYRDRLGFDITFQGPAPDDIFFGIVQRGAAMIMLKDVGVEPVPNYRRDVKKGWARWDAYLDVPDPDALAAEFASRHVEFSQPLADDDDGLRGFALMDADGYVLYFGRPR